MEEFNLKKVVTDLNNKKLAAIQNIEALDLVMDGVINSLDYIANQLKELLLRV